MQKTIVVIDDEEDILELLEYHLENEGFETVGFLSTANVEKMIEEERVDLIIVDRNLPGVEGSEFVKKLRNDGINIPVIFLTAKSSECDIVDGFTKGGDDYIAKPFSMSELIARVKSILRRTNPEIRDEIIFRDIKINNTTKKVYVENRDIELTKLEFKLLLILILSKNIVLSRDYLLEKVWKDSGDYQAKTVNVAIKRLKEKIDPLKNKDYIKTIRGEGYTIS